MGLAYAPLGSPLNLKEEGKETKEIKELFKEPVLLKIADKYKRPVQ